MKKNFKKSGQKILRKFSRASLRAGEEGKEHIKENLFGRVSHISNIRLLILEWALLVVALILLAVTQAFWFGDSYAENAFVDGGTYTEATLGDVKSMNPLFAMTNSEKTLSRLMFATISTMDYSGHMGEGLAKYIVSSDDNKTWTVKIRDGLKWSDGEDITNEDIMFTIGLIKNPVVNSIYDSNFANVKVSENENQEIVFNLPVAYADFISALNIPVLPKHSLENTDPKTLIEDSFSNSPVTSGAFSFNAMQAGATNNEQIIYLSSNPHHYSGKAMLNSFAVHTYNNIDDIVNAVNSGAVTATAELSGLDAEKITAGQFNRKESSLNSGAFIFFKTTSEMMKNADLRKAIRLGINIEEIRSNIPEAASLDYPILPQQIKLENYPEIPAYGFEEAKNKISELSGETPIHVDIATVTTGYLPSVAEAVAEALRNLGLDVNVTSYQENQEFITNVISKRNYDILIYEIEMGVEPDPLPYYHSSQTNASGLNLSNYRNSLVDDLLLGARDATDTALRAKKYEAFLEHFVDDVPAIGLYQSNLTYFYNKNVRTFSNNIKLVTALDRFTDVDSWAVVKATKNKTP